MLRSGVQRLVCWNKTVGTRYCSAKVSWSTGEVTHPAPPDCPLGNKGDYPQKLSDGSIQYFGFKYYPRHPEEVDPPYEPAPLHLVTRTRSLKGQPYREKDILKKFGLFNRRSGVAIVKNNPENNANLWKIKHLVKITPLRVPNDLPDDVDPRYCFIKETGEFSFSPRIQFDDHTLEEDEEITRTKWTPDFIDKHTRKNWEHPWQLKLC